MTDTPPPKRRFWQIHLSTAVVMMILSGALLGLNLKPARIVSKRIFPPTKISKETMLLVLEGEGWPVPRFSITLTYPAETVAHGWTPEFKLATFANQDQPGEVWSKREVNIAVNFMICLTLLVAVLSLCEYLLRRRSKP